jgi:hypothetical protein
VRVTQAYRFALDPTPAQERALASHCGASRFAYNWGLGLVRDRLEQRRRVREAGYRELLSDAEVEALARGVEVPWTLPALRREWNLAKHRLAPWWAENSKESYSSGLDALARALRVLGLEGGSASGPAGRVPTVQASWSRAGVVPVHDRGARRAGPYARSVGAARSFVRKTVVRATAQAGKGPSGRSGTETGRSLRPG